MNAPPGSVHRRAVLAALLIGGCAHPAHAEVLRHAPYPYGAVVSIASDVDMQQPWHGRSIHRFVNEQLGLTLGDSLWASGATHGLSYLFSPDDARNRHPSEVEGHSTFGLLVREWHRGNIDVFHGWQDDATYRLIDRIEPGRPVFCSGATVELKRAPPAAVGGAYANLRLTVDRMPATPLNVEFRFSDGSRRALSGVRPELAGRVQFKKPPGGSFLLEFRAGGGGGEADGVRIGPRNLVHLQSIAFAGSFPCNDPGAPRLSRVERDAYSRETVRTQARMLKALGVRPSLYTSHGGVTWTQNLSGLRPERMHFKRLASSAFADASIDAEAIPAIDLPESHAYAVDLLRDLGVQSGWPAIGSRKARVPLLEGADLAERLRAPFWQQAKSFILIQDPRGEEYLGAVKRTYRFYRSGDERRHACAPPPLCEEGQGGRIGLALDVALQALDHGRRLDAMLYQHLGTIAATTTARIRPGGAPFDDGSMAAFAALADRVYDPRRAFSTARRPWFPAASVHARYRIASRLLRGRITVDGEDRVRIASVADPVTSHPYPTPGTGARDLHGITVYVRDSRRARVFLDSHELPVFVRNPPDETGKPSITLVDESRPTALVGRAPLDASATVKVEGGVLERAGQGRSEMAFRALGRKATVELGFRDLRLWNITHLSLRHAVAGPGRFFFELILPDGRTIRAEEQEEGSAVPADAFWRLPVRPDGDAGDRKRAFVLATSNLVYAPGTRVDLLKTPALPLPIGRIARLRFGLIEAAPGAVLKGLALHALSPDGTASEQGPARMVGGRVTRGGRAARNVEVALDHAAGRRESTLTDEDGYYFFANVPKGALVGLSAFQPACRPHRGTLHEVLRHEAELDIEVLRCGGR